VLDVVLTSYGLLLVPSHLLLVLLLQLAYWDLLLWNLLLLLLLHHLSSLLLLCLNPLLLLYLIFWNGDRHRVHHIHQHYKEAPQDVQAEWEKYPCVEENTLHKLRQVLQAYSVEDRTDKIPVDCGVHFLER